MIEGPKLEDRAKQATRGIRTQVPMRDLPTVIPDMTGEVFDWLQKNHVEPPSSLA